MRHASNYNPSKREHDQLISTLGFWGAYVQTHIPYTSWVYHLVRWVSPGRVLRIHCELCPHGSMISQKTNEIFPGVSPINSSALPHLLQKLATTCHNFFIGYIIVNRLYPRRFVCLTVIFWSMDVNPQLSIHRSQDSWEIRQPKKTADSDVNSHVISVDFVTIHPLQLISWVFLWVLISNSLSL